MSAGTGGENAIQEMKGGERVLMVVMTVLMVALPLTAITVIAGIFCHLLGTGTQLPGWGVIAIAIPAAALTLGLFIGSMGNDMMDVIVGSAIILVLAVILVPVFIRAQEAGQRSREKQQLQQLQQRSPLEPSHAPAVVR